MRGATISITAASAGLALALSLAACGGGDPDEPDDPPVAAPTPTIAPPPETEPPEHGWDSHVQVDFDTGEIRAPGFNDLIDTDAPQWADDPQTTVEVLLRVDELEGTVEIDPADDADAPVVVVTNSDLPDDSVTAIRYEITLAAGDDGQFRFASGEASWRCQPDRGHQEFDTGMCT